MKKIAFTGGGTIGHVAVNLALIPEAQNVISKQYILISKTVSKKK